MPIASLLVSTRSLILKATFARNLTTMEQVNKCTVTHFLDWSESGWSFHTLTCSHLQEEIIYLKLKVKCKRSGKKRSLSKLMLRKTWNRRSNLFRICFIIVLWLLFPIPI